MNFAALMTTAVLAMAALAQGECVGPEALESKLLAHPDAAIYVELGNWFDQHQQYSCAVQSYRSALKVGPASATTFERLGASLYSAGEVDASVEALQRSIQLAPENLTAHVRLATVLDQLQQTEAAKAQWRRALQIDPHWQPALDGFSRHLIAQGDFEAVITLLRGSKLDETLTLDLAQAYGKAGMLKKAEELLTAAIRKEPTSFSLLNALATVYVNQGSNQKALQITDEFVAKQPEQVDAQTLRLRLLLVTEDRKEASALAQRLLGLRPRDPYLLYVLGTLERYAGQFDRARDHLQLAVTVQPDVHQSHFGLGLVLLKLDDLPRAKEEFEKAISLGAPDAEVHLELATVLRKLGDPQASERELKLARETNQSLTNRSVAQQKMTHADSEVTSGSVEKAVELYREALEATPDDAMLHYKLSVALDKLGNAAEEKAELEKALQFDPGIAAAHNQLGYLASRSGEAQSAEEHFQKAVNAAPNFTNAWMNLAATLAMQGKIPEARTAVETALKLEPNNKEALQLRQELATSLPPALNLGLEQYKNGDYENARQQFEIAHKLQPDDVRITILLADSNMHLNNPGDAVSLLRPLATANSQDMDVEFLYGAALIGTGERIEGVRHVERAAESKQNADAYRVAGEARLAIEDFKQAGNDLEAALKLDATLPRIHTLVGIARDKNGQTTEAEAAFREALKINPDDFEANLYLGAILSQRRDLEEAKQYLNRALELNPGDSMARYENAILKSAFGDYEVAAKEMEQLVNSNPDWLEPHLALSTLYYKVHRPADGAREREIVDRLSVKDQARGTRAR